MPKFESKDMEANEVTFQFANVFHIDYVVDLVEMFVMFVFYIHNYIHNQEKFYISYIIKA